MEATRNQQYFDTKTDDELDVLVANAAGLTLKSLAGEGGWVDSKGALIHLQSEFKPTSRANFALSLLHELAADGNVIALNTADVMTKEDVISIGGFPKKGTMEFPIVISPVSDVADFGVFRKTILRSISIFYIMHKNATQEILESIFEKVEGDPSDPKSVASYE